MEVLNANKRNARVAVGRAEHTVKSKQGSITTVIWVSVSRRGERMQRCPERQTSDVNETSQGKIEKIRHTDISTLDTRDTSDTDHRAEVGDSCKRVKKCGKKV